MKFILPALLALKCVIETDAFPQIMHGMRNSWASNNYNIGVRSMNRLDYSDNSEYYESFNRRRGSSDATDERFSISVVAIAWQ